MNKLDGDYVAYYKNGQIRKSHLQEWNLVGKFLAFSEDGLAASGKTPISPIIPILGKKRMLLIFPRI